MALFSFCTRVCKYTHSASVFAGATVSSSFGLSVRNLAKIMGLPRVFFDMTADGQPVGRIVIEVSG